MTDSATIKTSAPDTAPLPWKTIPEMFNHNTQLLDNKTAIVDQNIELSFQELHQNTTQLAAALQRQGIEEGDRIAIWAPNSVRWITLSFAAWQLGAIIVPISTRLTAFEAVPILQHTEAKLLATVEECAGNYYIDMLKSHDDFSKLDFINTIISLDVTSSTDEDVIGYSQFQTLGEQLSSFAPPKIEPDNIAEILYTSGTTGQPKGVPLKHNQLLQNYWDWSGLGSLSEDDNYLVIAPFSHGFGINAGFLASMIRGMTCVLIDIFEPAKALDLIETYEISVMGGPPTLFTSLIDCGETTSKDISSLRIAYVGAANVPEDIINRMHQKLGYERVINAYGLIEACSVTMTRAEDPIQTISTTVGRPLPGFDIKIIDTNGCDVPDGDNGEITVNSYGVMEGYWKDPERTQDAIIHDQPSNKKWFKTGDVGHIDINGNLTIVGRTKEMFICSGFNAYPSEIESVLSSFPGISQIAVIGMKDPVKGEVGAAFIVPTPNAKIDKKTLISWAQERLANYKVPRHLFIRESLPLNANGKVMKDQLKTQVANPVGAVEPVSYALEGGDIDG